MWAAGSAIFPRPWEHPTPFDLHYGEDWRARFENDLDSGAWRRWNDEQNRDPDLASHVIILQHRCLCLQGPSIADIFPDVPPEDYRASIVADVEWTWEGMAGHPAYALLNPCRVLWYLREGRVCSKDEAGAWAVDALSSEFRDTLRLALAIYRGESEERSFSEAILQRFAAYITRRIGAVRVQDES